MKLIYRTSLVFSVVTLLLISCKKGSKMQVDANVDAISLSQDSIAGDKDSAIVYNDAQPQVFAFPSEIQGCSCYFAKTKTELEQEKYIYIDDYGNSGYIKIEGKLEKILMEEGDFDPSNFNKTIENDFFKVQMQAKKVNEKDEILQFQGKMIITNKLPRGKPRGIG